MYYCFFTIINKCLRSILQKKLIIFYWVHAFMCSGSIKSPWLAVAEAHSTLILTLQWQLSGWLNSFPFCEIMFPSCVWATFSQFSFLLLSSANEPHSHGPIACSGIKSCSSLLVMSHTHTHPNMKFPLGVHYLQSCSSQKNFFKIVF